jgi:hypothetical protein
VGERVVGEWDDELSTASSVVRYSIDMMLFVCWLYVGSAHVPRTHPPDISQHHHHGVEMNMVQRSDGQTLCAIAVSPSSPATPDRAEGGTPVSCRPCRPKVANSGCHRPMHLPVAQVTGPVPLFSVARDFTISSIFGAVDIIVRATHEAFTPYSPRQGRSFPK